MFAALSPLCITENAMLDVLSTTSTISFSCPITATSIDRHDVWNYRSIEFVQQFNNETSKVRVTVHLWGESTGDWWFPAQRERNRENVSIWWRHNVKLYHSIHRQTGFSIAPIPTENRNCFHPRIAVSIVPVVISIIKSIPLLNSRMYVLFCRAKFMPDDYGLCTPGCSGDLSVLSFSDLCTS